MRLTLRAYDQPSRKHHKRKHAILSWQAELLALIHPGKRTKSRSGKPLKYWER